MAAIIFRATKLDWRIKIKLKAIGKADIGDLSYIDDPRALLFPIPNNEIVTNPNMVQNEGY